MPRPPPISRFSEAVQRAVQAGVGEAPEDALGMTTVPPEFFTDS